jgi:acyl-CoA thioesterase FadM
MAKVKLNPLHNYSFQTKIKVRITDINYGGHLGNDRLLSLIHEARIAFLAIHGFSELECGGVSLIMADTVIIYQGEAFAGDDLLIEVSAGEPSQCGFRLFYRVSRLKDKAAIALVENGMVCFDYTNKKVKRLPNDVKKICLEIK